MDERKHAQALILASCIGRLDALKELMKINHDVYKDKDQNTDVIRTIPHEVIQELERLKEELHDEACGIKTEAVV